ncbi:DUF4145 domain-containing protein [Streptomyces parvus]|uniref:DUF4145 domain-containing protein n=1 Tax=Streptomyces parvus TaxID=66428 RepID=UPI002100B219|nr:DUF4145 domain-containing protein [Streptomyces parvus]MCQ1579316.1 DUF4145 domain-containing protein [Streptomyces parvus]
MASTICGWCGDRTHMKMVLEPYMLPEALWPIAGFGRIDTDHPVYMSAFRCPNENCERLSIGWAPLYKRASGTPKDQLPRTSLEWEPTKIRRPAFPDVPKEIAATASEAHACLSIGAARGAVALARAVVEATAKAKGITVRNIAPKITAMRDQGIISPLTEQTSHQIRKDGNSIAHGDIGEESMPLDDAEAILHFMDTLLDEVFQRPAKLKRLSERGAASRPAESAKEAGPVRGGTDLSPGSS